MCVFELGWGTASVTKIDWKLWILTNILLTDQMMKFRRQFARLANIVQLCF